MERSKNREKNYVITVKKIHVPKRVDRTSTFFEISRNLIRKICFQVTLNARKSCADGFLKIKTNDNRARFSRN